MGVCVCVCGGGGGIIMLMRVYHVVPNFRGFAILPFFIFVTGSGKRARNSLLLHTRYTRNNAKSLTSANFNLRHRWVGQHVGNVRTKFQSQPARSSKVIEVCVTSVQ